MTALSDGLVAARSLDRLTSTNTGGKKRKKLWLETATVSNKILHIKNPIKLPLQECRVKSGVEVQVRIGDFLRQFTEERH